jgi:UDP-4-amino-4,6-dideoxy-N-acetyl-beta-L-altrosamine N-acetyltransferase
LIQHGTIRIAPAIFIGYFRLRSLWIHGDIHDVFNIEKALDHMVSSKRIGLLDTVETLSLHPITDLQESSQLKVLEIRNQPGVRNNMYTIHEISRQEHLQWIEKLKQTSSTRFFAVIFENEIIGGVSLNAINTEHGRADWAYYLSEAMQGKGIGSALEFKFLDFVFLENNFQKLNCEVLAFNDKVISLHNKFGFQQEGVRRNHILRDEKACDIVLLGITKDEWLQRRAALVSGVQ